MLLGDFEKHLVASGYTAETSTGNKGGEYLVIRGVVISGGAQDGTTCDVGIKKTSGNPWVPEAAVHVRPHLVKMREAASQASELGTEWQYLSRRYERASAPRAFLAHILTVLGQL